LNRPLKLSRETAGEDALKPHRPIDLAREHGLSAQAVRNYEAAGVLPPAERTATGYRRYTDRHASALRAFLALVHAHGHAAAGEIMRAVHRGDLDAALRTIDAAHSQLVRDRETLDAVERTARHLAAAPQRAAADRPVSIGVLAHRLQVVPATLRKWERAGILAPGRDRGTRRYGPDDVRDAELAHLLRRGGYRLDHIATVLDQVRAAGGAEPLAASLADWRRRLVVRGRTMLDAAARLAEHLG